MKRVFVDTFDATQSGSTPVKVPLAELFDDTRRHTRQAVKKAVASCR